MHPCVTILGKVCYMVEFLKLCPLVEENIILGFPCINHEDIVLNFCLITAKYQLYTVKESKNPYQSSIS